MSAQRGTCHAIALAFILSGALRLDAQALSQKELRRLQSDSAAWQNVLTYVVRELSSELVRAAADTSAQPWRIRVTPSEPQHQLLEAKLRTILRARPVASDDSVFQSLDFGPLVILNDTARVKVQAGTTRRCRGTTRTWGFGWSTTVLVPRRPPEKMWWPAFSRVTRVGDGAAC